MNKFIGFIFILKFFSIIFKGSALIKSSLFAISLGTYSYLYSFEVSLILIGYILFYEIGHYYSLKKIGIKPKALYLIPFVGSGFIPNDCFKSRTDEMFVSIFGAIFGIIYMIFFIILYFIYENEAILNIISLVLLFNLINFLPIQSFSGGKIIKAIFLSINNSIFAYLVLFSLFILSLYFIYINNFILLLFVSIISFFEFIYVIYKFISFQRNKKHLIIEKNRYLDKFKNIDLNNNEKIAYNNLLKLNKDNLEILLKDNEDFNTKPLNKKEIYKYSFLYIFFVFLFIISIIFFSHYSETNIALKLLQSF